MKALFKIQRAAKTAQPTLNYTLTLKGKQRDKLDLDARVGAVMTSPDLEYLQPKLAVGDKVAIKQASKQIESHTRLFAKSGMTNNGKEARHRDHYTISASSGMGHKQFEKLAKKAMPDLAKKLKLKSYVAVIHTDCPHPHVHIIADAYAPSIGKGQRRHLDRDQLKEMDSMNWTKHFEPPLPSLDAPRSERGKTIQNIAFKGTSKEKVDFASHVFGFLGGKIDTVEKMAKKLEKVKLPKDFKCDFYNKAGKLKPSASISNGKTTLRLSNLVKQKENYLNTSQFKEVTKKQNPPKAKIKEYVFNTPTPVKIVVNGVKEVLNVFKQASSAVTDMLSLEAPEVPSQSQTVKVVKKRKTKGEWKIIQEEAMNSPETRAAIAAQSKKNVVRKKAEQVKLRKAKKKKPMSRSSIDEELELS